MSDQKEEVNHPSRYNAGSVECIDAIESALTPEEYRGFIKGTVLRYVWREKHKGGDQDMQKAGWYMRRLSDFEKKRERPTTLTVTSSSPSDQGFVAHVSELHHKLLDAERALESVGFRRSVTGLWLSPPKQSPDAYSALIEGCGRITADKETVDKINARIAASLARDIDVARKVQTVCADTAYRAESHGSAQGFNAPSVSIARINVADLVASIKS